MPAERESPDDVPPAWRAYLEDGDHRRVKDLDVFLAHRHVLSVLNGLHTPLGLEPLRRAWELYGPAILRSWRHRRRPWAQQVLEDADAH
jgi:hypothetical protein